MENRFENTPPEEQQGWGAYATPPPYPGHTPMSASTPPILPQDLGLCERVREKLPYLLENEDGEISPMMAKAIYGHLAVCADCSREFDENQRVVSYLDALPPVELPMDFSGLIQRRIQLQGAALQGDAVVSAQAAASTSGSGTVQKRNLVSRVAAKTTQRQTNITTTRQISQTQNGQSPMPRVVMGSVFAAVLAYFVSTSWGQEMLGQNVAAVRLWLEQVGAVLSRIPLLGRIAALIFAALSQMGDLLGDTYRTVGDMAVRGLAMDVALCLAAYYFLVARKQRDQLRGI